MKAKEIAKRVKVTRFAAVLRDHANRQWITDGLNAYLADENILLTEGNLLGVLDIEQSKRDKIRVGTAEATAKEEKTCEALMDVLGIERRAEDEELIPGVSVCFGGDAVTSLRWEDGSYCWVRQSELKPADGEVGLGFLRRGAYVATMGDLFVNAIVRPLDGETQYAIEEQLRQVVNVENDEELLERLRLAERRADMEHERAEAAAKRAVAACRNEAKKGDETE